MNTNERILRLEEFHNKTFKVTRAWLEKNKMPSGRHIKKQIFCLDINWPPSKNWVDLVDGIYISQSNRLFFEKVAAKAKRKFALALEKKSKNEVLEHSDEPNVVLLEDSASSASKNPVKKFAKIPESFVKSRLGEGQFEMGHCVVNNNGPFFVTCKGISARPGHPPSWFFAVKDLSGIPVYEESGIYKDGITPQSTKTMELQAVCSALYWLDGREARVVTGSHYVFKMLKDWALEFKSNGWRIGPMRKDPPAPHIAYIIHALDHMGRADLFFSGADEF